MNNKSLVNQEVSVQVKLAALWTVAMFMYLYNDLIQFVLQPGSLTGVLAGSIGGLEITQPFLVAAAFLVIIPAVMIYLSTVLNPQANRWTNIIVGALFTLVTLATMLMPGEEPWAYYLIVNGIEIAATGLVVWHAWTWPRQ